MGVGFDHEQAAGALAGSEKPEERSAASSRVTAADLAWRRPLLFGVAEVFGQSSSLAGAAWSDAEHRMLKCVSEYGGAEVTATSCHVVAGMRRMRSLVSIENLLK